MLTNFFPLLTFLLFVHYQSRIYFSVVLRMVLQFASATIQSQWFAMESFIRKQTWNILITALIWPFPLLNWFGSVLRNSSVCWLILTKRNISDENDSLPFQFCVPRLQFNLLEMRHKKCKFGESQLQIFQWKYESDYLLLERRKRAIFFQKLFRSWT